MVASWKEKGLWPSYRILLPALPGDRTEHAARKNWSSCPDRGRLPIRRRQKHRDTGIAVTHAHLAQMDTARSQKDKASCGSTGNLGASTMTAHGPGEMHRVPKPLSNARALSGRSPDEDLDDRA